MAEAEELYKVALSVKLRTNQRFKANTLKVYLNSTANLYTQVDGLDLDIEQSERSVNFVLDISELKDFDPILRDGKNQGIQLLFSFEGTTFDPTSGEIPFETDPFSVSFVPMYDGKSTSVVLYGSQDARVSTFIRQKGFEFIEDSIGAILMLPQSFEVNDASLPFGGSFPPHSGHQTGKELDVLMFGPRDFDYVRQNKVDRLTNEVTDTNGKIVDMKLYMEYSNCLLDNPGTCTRPDVEMDRFRTWVIDTRLAFHEFSKLNQSFNLKISDGRWALNRSLLPQPPALGNPPETKFWVHEDWHSKAITHGVWPDGEPIENLAGEPIGPCFHSVLNDLSEKTAIDRTQIQMDCNVSVLQTFFSERIHFDHIHVEF